MKQSWTSLSVSDPQYAPFAYADVSIAHLHVVIVKPGSALPWAWYGAYRSLRQARRHAAAAPFPGNVAVCLMRRTGVFVYSGPLKGR